MTSLLEGRRILVVEDEYLAALDMADMVERQGGTVVGPVGRLDPAILLALAERLDGAVLDVRLGRETSLPLAELLSDRGVPLIFATGYDSSQLPNRFAGTPRLAKPLADGALERALKQVFGAV